MVREIWIINVGQCGVQFGEVVWKQFNAEHKIDENGIKKDQTKDPTFLCFYEETAKYPVYKLAPRNIMIDLDPDTIDNIKESKYSSFFDPEFLISGKEDAANNFAGEHYTVGKEIIDKVNDQLRKLDDNCDNVQGFVINHSVEGGNGSGLGALILEIIAVDFGRKQNVKCDILCIL